MVAAVPSNAAETVLPDRCDPITVNRDPATNGVAWKDAAFTTCETVGSAVMGGGGGGTGGAGATLRGSGRLWPPPPPPLIVMVAWYVPGPSVLVSDQTRTLALPTPAELSTNSQPEPD